MAGTYVRTEAHRQQQRLLHLGEKHGLWKGDQVSYKGLHAWINHNLPKPELCQICNQKKLLAAACVTGIYSRDFSNWKYICWKCHAKLDNLGSCNKGKKLGPLSKEHRMKIALANTGKLVGPKNPMYGMTGDKNPFYGKHHTEETKLKMRLAKLNKK